MREFSQLFLFPDINVWVALTYQRHVHHAAARSWFAGLSTSARLFFCRVTQVGLLRLLSAASVMGPDEVMSQREAWRTYDSWLEDERVGFLDEPGGVETAFRALTQSAHASPKEWADAYLAAFAYASRLTVVTFDRALQKKSKGVLLPGV